MFINFKNKNKLGEIKIVCRVFMQNLWILFFFLIKKENNPVKNWGKEMNNWPGKKYKWQMNSGHFLILQR